MRVLMDVSYPLAWAPGGHSFLIKETIRGLEALGVEVVWLHYDAEVIPAADIVHFWSHPKKLTYDLARLQGARTILSTMRSVTREPSPFERRLRKVAIQTLPKKLRLPGVGLFGLEEVDALLVLNETEKHYFMDVWGFSDQRVFSVNCGVDEIFFDTTIEPIPFAGLVCVGYISRAKNSLETARAAHAAKVPIKFIGKGRVDGDAYVRAFQDLVDNRYVFWEGEVNSRAVIASHLRGAKGFILPSRHEAQSIAILEALACQKPVMTSKLINLQEFYGDAVWYCDQPEQASFLEQLKDFAENCTRVVKTPFRVLTWKEVAQETLAVYQKVLNHVHPS